MQLQNVYFAHGLIALTGRPLIREPIEAWDYGPVVRPSIVNSSGMGLASSSNLLVDFEPVQAGGFL